MNGFFLTTCASAVSYPKPLTGFYSIASFGLLPDY
jgi:hypothetical protein